MFCAGAGASPGYAGGPAIKRFIFFNLAPKKIHVFLNHSHSHKSIGTLFKKIIFYSQYKDGKERYFLVGTVIGNVAYDRRRGLPDIYNFIGNKEVSSVLSN